MPQIPPHVELLIASVFGFGIVLGTVVFLSLPTWSLRARRRLTMGMTALTMALTLASIQSVELLLGTLAGLLVLTLLPELPGVLRQYLPGENSILTRSRRIGLGSAGVTLGFCILGWGATRYEEQLAEDLAFLEQASEAAHPPLVAAPGSLCTDKGTPINAAAAVMPRPAEEEDPFGSRIIDEARLTNRVIRLGGADPHANCHGWVFTGGRFWLTGPDVERILTENGYVVVTDPQPGDLAIYRDGSTIGHTAVVRYVTPGLPVLVEGKWGANGVYLHPVEGSIYGRNVTYYRSTRNGHILAAPSSVVGP